VVFKLRTSLDRGSKNPFLETMSRELFDDLVGNQSFSLKEVNFAEWKAGGSGQNLHRVREGHRALL